MIEQQYYIDAAIKELSNPTLESTAEYIDEFKIVTKIVIPEIIRIHEDVFNNVVSVYFKLDNEKIFIVINLTVKPNIQPIATWIESGHRVYLTATSDKLHFNELGDLIKLKPLEGWSIGELHPNKKSKYSFTRISYEPNKNEAYDLDEKLNSLLTELEKDKSGIEKLTAYSDVYISLCRYQYVQGNMGIHFDIETINRLQKLNVSIDIDTYIVGNRLTD